MKSFFPSLDCNVVKMRHAPPRSAQFYTKQAAAIVSIIFGVLVSACERPPEPVTGPSSPRKLTNTVVPARAVVGSKYRRPDEDRFVAIGREAASFAGFFIDTISGDIVVQVADSAHFGLARAAMQRRLADDSFGFPRAYRSRRIVIRRVEYTFQQLSDWRDIASDSILGRYSTEMLDLDEVRNRVTISVPAGQQAPLRQALETLGIPVQAVHFRDARGIRPLRPLAREAASRMYVGSLRYQADTLAGGFQITPGCTLAFVGTNLTYGNIGVGASHCSQTFWSTDFNTFYQPHLSANAIGIEVVDPPPGTCPALWFCNRYRYSDASLIDLAFGVTIRKGFLARPASRVTGTAGSYLVNGSNPWLTITAAFTTGPVSGMTIDKIGVTSGWTYGTVIGTCADANLYGSWPTYDRVRCVGEATYYADGGDSGGPVFYYDGADGVILAGVQSACNGGLTPCNDGLFSTFGNVQNELGTLNVATDITVGTPNVSGSLSGGVVNLSWSAVATTNTTATTVYKIFRSIWDASTYTWIQEGALVSTQTGTSFNDSPVTLSAYTGQTPPAMCTYTYVVYTVYAYNTGVGAASDLHHFRGNADGPTPWQVVCP